jgi:hypothetical protein
MLWNSSNEEVYNFIKTESTNKGMEFSTYDSESSYTNNQLNQQLHQLEASQLTQLHEKIN